MNKHEQIVLRVWRSTNSATCYRNETDGHVLVQNGFSILLLNNLDRIDPKWTYDKIDSKYDACMRQLDMRELHAHLNLPDMRDIKGTIQGKSRNAIDNAVSLTAMQPDIYGRNEGCLKVNIWYLYDFMWALGDNLNAFWSGQIVSRKLNGQIRTHARGGLYLAGSNGQALLMPIESKVVTMSGVQA